MKKTAKTSATNITAEVKARVEKAMSLYEEVSKHAFVRGMTIGSDEAFGVVHHGGQFKAIEIRRNEAGKFITKRKPLSLQQAARKMLENMETEKELGADIEVTDEGLTAFLIAVQATN